ncbi:endopeptidase La [Campylobacter ureolyticus]|uniref:Lon protease n=1 Tax=Campylobacter ureolyticus TaxID=827 RepID=A0A9Q4KNN2_9BACT|nr:endopeptidase La [Campylobacter ureolyticus]MCZ6102956.1 endopeptidase La [Campylobacter ureolyticus]MCZ6134284.1 endopeptidase La [Campylobacter ureolyticus]MCZ6161327.1 endopeptidase La [Campylobacter ureolyticus]MCZ6170389.1 endopeptidase La [Campylobacter ureolyticus]MDU4982262.1 endopeptidase La [Campylobacter ureolyticus]
MKISQNTLPIITMNGQFLYPFMITPIFIHESDELETLEFAIKNETMILVANEKENATSKNKFENIYNAGVVGNIMRKVDLPDGRVKILFQGAYKAKIVKEISQKPLLAEIKQIEIEIPTDNKIEPLLNILKQKIKTLNSMNGYFSQDLLRTIEESSDAIRVLDLTLSALRLTKDKAYDFFIKENLEELYFDTIDYIIQEIEANRLEKEIKSKVHSKIEKTNKEYFLKEQLKQIQKELGNENEKEEEVLEYRKKLDLKKPFMSDEAYKEIKKQIDKFARLHPDSADASMAQSYLDWVLEIPFENLAKKKSSMSDVKKQLDSDHYALTKPKDRIVEYFALRELLELRGLKDKVNNGIILCLAGPPGVGKTSLANSVAKALKRELVRIALGGLEDVNELRGHRRTYVGAMPGRIVQGLIDAKQMNPVMVLDEIDKISRNFRGDPTAVLLEVLDPEQNNNFRDYYLNFNIDLSKIIFIATANDIGSIPPALRDRMEFIFLSSYTPQEKFQIAKKYLIPQELKKHGLKASDINISDGALRLLISDYTRESGVRNLRRKIADILRKTAVKILNQEKNEKVLVSNKNLEEFVDKKVFEIDAVDKKDLIGIVNGLAWTAVGGDVLKIEAIKIKGKGKLNITGQLGDVMKESAIIAFSVVKVLIDENKLEIPKKIYEKAHINISESEKSENSQNLKNNNEQIYNLFDLHLHVPEGATPKDGPSAGITMAVAIASILSNKKVKADIAMTGEITLSGKVLPIGGLKEKLIAAHKAGIKKALIPRKNYERDLDELPNEVKDAIEIIPVDIIDDVLENALV